LIKDGKALTVKRPTSNVSQSSNILLTRCWKVSLGKSLWNEAKCKWMSKCT